MIKPSSLFWCLLCLSFTIECSEKTNTLSSNQLSVAFYNLDNLYDTLNDPKTNDDEFTPAGKNKWNSYKYNQKIKKLCKVLSNFDAETCPDVLGVCEIENKSVLFDLASAIKVSTFDIVHFDSKDERGADVALLFNKHKLKLLESKKFTPVFKQDTSDYTRDVLWVKLLIMKSSDTLQFVVCHFPSRREGQVKSEPKRIEVAKLCKKIISEKCNLETQNLIVMGDFNDEPKDKSLSHFIGAGDVSLQPQAKLVNLMFPFYQDKIGSYRYKDNWNILDQFLISSHLMSNNFTHYVPNSVFIKNESWMLQKGKFAAYPHRTFAGNKWLNGYSDHLPIGLRIQIDDKKKN
jgi:predicted extracellular nuclease